MVFINLWVMNGGELRNMGDDMGDALKKKVKLAKKKVKQLKKRG